MTVKAWCSCGHEDNAFRLADGDLQCPRCREQMEVEIHDPDDEPEYKRHKGSDGQRIMEHRR